jgi:sigma-B regulation protein RsbU (phosphoserine phosphatase)
MVQSEVVEDLEDLYEHAPCGYISLGSDGRIVKSNLTFSELIGFTREELLGKRLRDLLSVAGSIFYETHFSPLLRMQGFFNEVALDLIKKDGGKLAVLANALERRDLAGNLQFTRVTIFEATERRRYERNLVDARAAAEKGLLAEREASELREQFIAVLGHDLRNPLAGLDAGIRRILRKGSEAATPELLDLMGGSVRRMQVLIENVLDLTRTRLGGGLQLDIENAIRIDPTLAQVVEELRIAHPEREIVTSIDAVATLNCDPARIGQLASNLLGNALTHGSSTSAVRTIGGMDRQTLRDWVHRFNAGGAGGLKDNWTGGVSPRLSADQKAELARIVEAGPDREKDGVVRWRRVDLQRVIAERFGVDYCERYVGALLKTLGFSHIAARPRHPGQDAEVIAAYKKTFRAR